MLRPATSWMSPPLGPGTTSLVTLAFFAFAVSHAAVRLGGLHTAVLIVVTFVVSLLCEIVGVLTGAIYGPYFYTDKLAPKIFGLVPVLIPLAWFRRRGWM